MPVEKKAATKKPSHKKRGPYKKREQVQSIGSAPENKVELDLVGAIEDGVKQWGSRATPGSEKVREQSKEMKVGQSFAMPSRLKGGLQTHLRKTQPNKKFTFAQFVGNPDMCRIWRVR